VDELHMAVKQFQNINLAIKYAAKAVGGGRRRALGAGRTLRVNLHAAKISKRPRKA